MRELFIADCDEDTFAEALTRATPQSQVAFGQPVRRMTWRKVLRPTWSAPRIARYRQPANRQRTDAVAVLMGMADRMGPRLPSREHEYAVRTLAEAEHVAAEEVRCRPLVHGLLRSLLDTTSGESGRLVRRMAVRADQTA